MAEVVAIVGKTLVTIVLTIVFIAGLLVTIDPTDIGIKILQTLNASFPNPMNEQFIMELRILGVVASILGFVGFILSIYFLWK